MSTLVTSSSFANTRKRSVRLGLIAGAALLLAIAGYLIFRSVSGPSATVAQGDFHLVAPIDMIVRIQKDGELQAVHNIEIRCKVEGRSTIQTIVPEGSTVKKGDVLLTLDSSDIRQKIDDTMLEVQKAQTDATAAREDVEIQQSINDANLQTAEVQLLLAKLDLEQYEKGTYPQALQDAQRAVEMARITVANAEKDLEQTMNLFSRGFVTPADVEKSKLESLTAKNSLQKAETELMVLQEYTHRKDQADKRNTLSQTQANLGRVKQQNASSLAQRIAAKEARERTLILRQRKLESLQEQLEACTVTAPTSGLVVYGSSGSRRDDRRVAEGTEVTEKQILFRLPDTSDMMAIVRIPEAQKYKLNVGQRARVQINGTTEPIWGTVKTIAVVYDSNTWWNPDLKEYPVEIALDSTPSGLKPGTSVQAQIIIDQEDNVLALPLPSIFSTGNDRYVFVRNGDQVRPQKVEIGASNETFAKVISGVEAGSQVLMLQAGQGRELLERAGIALATPQPQQSQRIPAAPQAQSSTQINQSSQASAQ
ncbi:MAG: efflux RND transporter periplasmic adaptor subunit [Phycisphaerales bacterium]|nr:efflux RND transporter periplasmic adaptor subunit [Phycisphaerales bacterium]